MNGEQTAYEVIASHCGKTIVAVEEKERNIIIRFNDNSHLVLKDQGCNTCGGHRVEGAEY
jgi:hypothetical protein